MGLNLMSLMFKNNYLHNDSQKLMSSVIIILQLAKETRTQKAKTMKQKITWSSLLGFGVLSIAVIALLLLTLLEAWQYHPLSSIVILIVTAGLGIAILDEAKHLKDVLIKKSTRTQLFFQGFSVLIGALAAYSISHDMGLGPVVASSLVGILAFILFPDYSVAAYCGSFVGMTSNTLLFNWVEVGLAGSLAGIVFVFTKDVFAGAGGKLGTIALIGTSLICTCLNRDFILLPIADWQTNAGIIAVSMIATPLTFYLNVNKKHGPVLASSIVGLAGGLILPAVFPQIGPTLAVVAFCASFAGMASKARFPNFWHMLIVALFAGIIFVFSTPTLGGAGGKLGTIAFSAVLATYGLRKVYNRIVKSSHSPVENQGV
jgi:hypothetical protein